jgi:hypothetical protein
VLPNGKLYNDIEHGSLDDHWVWRNLTQPDFQQYPLLVLPAGLKYSKFYFSHAKELLGIIA